MPGIAGAIGITGQDVQSLGTRMAATLRHRVDELPSFWASPSNMLCRSNYLIDERSIAATPDESRVLAFVGDLYNSEEIVRRYSLRSSSSPDIAAIVLALLQKRGMGAVCELDGSFALATFEAESETLHLANDRFSSRPLYYWASSDNRTVVFGSRVQTVLQHPLIPRKINERSLRDVIHYQRVHGTRTLVEDVSMLPPGTLLTASQGKVALRKWFSMEYEPEDRTEDYWINALAEAMSESTNRVLSGGSDAGLLLSGGLDSRMIVAAAGHHNFRCFHFNTRHNREYEVSLKIAAARNLPLVYLERPPNHYSTLQRPAVDIGSGQYSFVHGHSIGLLPLDDVDVVVHGFAPEIFFRGTNFPHRWRRLLGRRLISQVDKSLTAANVVDRIVTQLKYSQSRLNPQQFLNEPADSYRASVRSSAEELVVEAQSNSDNPFDWFTWADTRYHCKYPSFLFEEALRSYHRERSIVFHNHVLDLHLRMPPGARADSKIWIQAVRRLAPDLTRIVDANTGRPPLTSQRIDAGLQIAGQVRERLIPSGSRANEGSWPDFPRVLARDAQMRDSLRATLHDGEAIDPSIFDLGALDRALDQGGGRVDAAHLLLCAATFGLWHQQYGPPERGLVLA